MYLLFLLLLFTPPFQEVPLKPVEEFQIDLDYTFKQRYIADRNTTVHLEETRGEYERRTSTTPLPYLVINIKFLKLGEKEARVRVVDNNDHRIYNNRRVDEGEVISLDLGFTDDVKDRISAYEYTVYLLTAKKHETSRITLVIDEEGNFFVNGEKRGRF